MRGTKGDYIRTLALKDVGALSAAGCVALHTQPPPYFVICETREMKPILLVMRIRDNIGKAYWTTSRIGLLLRNRYYRSSSQHSS